MKYTAQDFCDKVEEIYCQHFPKSSCDVRYSNDVISSIYIKPYLAKSAKELKTIKDPLSTLFVVYPEKEIVEDIPLSDYIVLETRQCFIKTNAEIHIIHFKNERGFHDKILNILNEYFGKLKDELNQLVKDNRFSDEIKEFVKSKVM